MRCAGCRSKECPILEHPCLGPIRTDDVVAAVESLAREKRATHETGGRLAAVTGGS